MIYTWSQHVRDAELFDIIRTYIKCGIIEKIKTRPTITNLMVYHKADIEDNIISLFDQYPLVTKKSIDYKYFKDVENIFKKGNHITGDSWEQILMLKALKKRKADINYKSLF